MISEAVVQWLNELPASKARREFHKCCGAWWWCDQMVAARPFRDATAAMVVVADRFDAMPNEAWLEAFDSHPKIGDLKSQRMRLAGNEQWSPQEQAGVTLGDEATRQALAAGNQAYQQRFGYGFIICATGLAASEMLTQLHKRMHNDTDIEFVVACGEQRKITNLRLEKLTLPGS